MKKNIVQINAQQKVVKKLNLFFVAIVYLIIFLANIITAFAAPCNISLDSTLINSTNFSITKQCIIVNSTIINSAIVDSTISNSMVNASKLTDAQVYNSYLIGTNQTHSLIEDSSFCANVYGSYTTIKNNILTTGQIWFNGYAYFLPTNLSLVCQNFIPKTGYVLTDKNLIKNNDTITFTYYGAVGSNVKINASSLDTTSALIQLTDNKNSGVYQGSLNISAANSAGDGTKIILANIVDNLGNLLLANASVILDNTLPFAQIIVGDGLGVTLTRSVIIHLNYTDSNGILDCRFSNNPFTTELFEPCIQSKLWIIPAGLGNKTIYVEVRDTAKNIKNVSSEIELAPPLPDTTPPTAPIVYDGLEHEDLLYSNSNNSLFAHWFGSYDLESYYVFYRARIIVNNTNISGWHEFGKSTRGIIDNLNLSQEINYSIEVEARNLYNYSMLGRSNGVFLDLIAPNLTYFNSTIEPEENITYVNNTAEFIWNATDDVSLKGYSYVLDLNPNTVPDDLVELDKNVTSILFTGLLSGTYYFHLKAIDLGKNFNLRHKKINLLWVGPKISLVQPQLSTQNEFFNISGVVSTNSNIFIFVNSLNQINLSANATFRTEITLQNGTNTIYAIAISENNLSYTSNTIQFTKTTMQIANLSLEISVPITGTNLLSNLVYADLGGYLFGLGTESVYANPQGNGLATITSDENNPGLIFLSEKNLDLNLRNKNLNEAKFLESDISSFVDSKQRVYTAIILDPTYASLIGNESISSGKFELIIENTGKIDGKPKISLRIK